MPRVSICIPAFKPIFFETALKSAIAQSFGDTEIIVSDDCPTDAIEKICEKYAAFVTYSRNPNPGEYKNIIRLANLSNGEYTKYLFDDDVLHPFCVQYLLEALEATRLNNTKLAFSPRYVIDDNNQITNHLNGFGIDRLKVIEGAEFIRAIAMHHHNYLGEFSTVLLRTADFFDFNGAFSLFKVDDGIISGPLDISSWINLACRGSFVAHPFPLSFFRQHAASQSNPEVNPYFIYAITYYEEVLMLALERGLLKEHELPSSFEKLITHYSYWRDRYPELDLRIARFKGLLGQANA